MRKPIVVGNWKMHKDHREAAALASEIVSAVGDSTAVETVLCPTYASLESVAGALDGSPVQLGAQNVHWATQGAFTGEISAWMLKEIGCRYVIVGHSERRSLFGETNADVNKKAMAVLEADMHPIVCIGETLEQREDGSTEEVLRRQLQQSLRDQVESLREMVVAYEPVWAIGTGRTATPDQVQAAHAFIRRVVTEYAGEGIAAAMRIQYGGSVNPTNAADLFALEDVDGGLIGGASLEAGSFSKIVLAAAG